ncbi:MAG: gamma-glutamyltransferase [Deltaproteobacteria bacterium]|nr:MAG: gamma-glutamyltransferase [Deltaproteobacteria bacterium]
MQGVIACGSEPTAAAGTEILKRGGNAADAAVAACLATATGEPTLTSLAGAGIMIYRSAASGEVTICDFISDAPKLGPDDVDQVEFLGVDLDFGPATQRFYIGAGSAAVPGVIPGLCQVLERWGTMSFAEVVKPACRLLREGVDIGEYQGACAQLLVPILTRNAGGRAVFAPQGRMVKAGDHFALPELADTLEAMAKSGWRNHYEQVLCKAMLDQFGPHAGGLLTAADFDSYQVQFREPLVLRYRNATVLTVPPPAAGGPMIAMMLRLLEDVDLAKLEPYSVDHCRLMCHVMTVADEARSEGAAALTDDRFAHWKERFDELSTGAALAVPSGAGGSGSTTHVSVIDGAGNAAAVTVSYGEGNAFMIGNSGIMMNNLMGEEDLHPAGFGSAPKGTRLATMMSPTMLLSDDGGVTVLGTGGANRIRTAIVQVVSWLSDYGWQAPRATSAPRMHYENGVFNIEVGEMADDGDALATLGATELVRFPKHSLFFGGVHLARRSGSGDFDGAGDPRRGGTCRIL